jgi:hypothetical protein
VDGPQHVVEFYRVGTQQTREIADAVVAALTGREHKQAEEELPNAKHGAKLDREGALGLGFEGVHDAWRNANVLSGLHAGGADIEILVSAISEAERGGNGVAPQPPNYGGARHPHYLTSTWRRRYEGSGRFPGGTGLRRRSCADKAGRFPGRTCWQRRQAACRGPRESKG